ncbi:MAG: tRNA (N(6)-L-threonylcarbamoyladenosine(37)-C(2))-methylthiotransferase MtaB [Rickettsiales bacterium]|nr:tRNA (N(6)-L-threonylcarbamoyladenosine(37)-C(2))-methylthiotransferase MtaB [Pseudomonadota bacterium]MDA0966785.1 tRNA (N(6)-L-threonylcarbamoyladenosine(37)-C(2))-methylthiotransferase MtaB [Pseudomonadota bacterium]MDG4543457.1 tRNA (N(6)-L-threonylcarbamoyladenosine(37)-C(2))-methylthiotransferase MtaB [Rickettsiales bacterium]MDG4546149.1 tRNA (N(6)-L-threonylcarbamoyladenosine(37)-C(2))-methylthiotransferase MtaB [Rickettsiales bacterium]MDG4547622.1 tRNA (N(6)-L-threonylcarbamoyladen
MKQEVVTFGCRLNAYESEVIKSNLLVAGLDDVIVFNTCSVTKEAERQARQSIRRARRNNPNAKIIVTGCAAQISPEKFSKMEEVDKILGNEEKLHAHNYNFGEKISVNDIMSVKETASHFVGSIEGKARAFVQVQNGCNHRCTFCIIPYGRGNSRSVPIGEIVKQVRQLVESGYNEVVITGVDITDYGKDLPGQPTLGQMLRRLLALVPNLPRLRLSSVDVAELDDDIYGLIEKEPRLMPHFHISLQAGDDMILKRMKRRHKRQDVVDFTEKVRRLRPDSAFGADIIAGFPTETDEMFENTLNLISEAGLQYLHIFPYSEREGTPAAKMPQVAKDIRKERAAKLREAGEKELIKHLQKNIGKTLKAVVEKDMIARAEDFSEISINKELEIGTIVDVNITRLDGNRLFGNL